MTTLRFAAVLLLSVTCCRGQSAPASEAPIKVKCVPLATQSLDETLTLPGRVQPPPGGDLPVASQVPGRIVEVLVHEGQHIDKGDTVANVDDVASRDALHQAEATLAQARAAETNAQATLERINALVSKGIAARQEQDDAKAREETERQAALSASSAVDLARRTLNRVQVKSAFSGVLTRVWRGPGALVDGTSATPIVQIAASSGAEFVAAATERELVRTEIGQTARVQLDADPEVTTGQVRARSSALDPTTGLGSVRLTIDPSHPTMVMGAYGRATLVTRHREHVLMLPSEALRGAIADGAQVAVCQDGKAELRDIKIGYRDQDHIEVIEGVALAERVAVDHVLGLDTGTPIEETH